MADWSGLPRDMLTLITSFLPLADTHRFSSVCQNWCSVIKEKLPWLVLTDDESTGKRRFFNMSENKHYQFDIPELRGAFIVGSSFGWLFAVGPKLDAYLVNPFSGVKFTFPSLPIHSERFRPENLDDHVERRGMSGRPRNACFERVQHILVMKALLSADPSSCTNFMVFIVLAGDSRLAFYKPGDTIWRVFDYEEGLDDIVFFKGQLYALLEDNVLATADMRRKPRLRIRACLRPYYDTISYLVDYNGTSLLLVARLREKGKDDGHFITTKFHVFKIDLKSYKTCELKDIDGHALFLGRNDGIVVRASEFNGCIANSIYFCDATYAYPNMKYGFDDMGVYNLKDRSIRKFYPPELYHPPQSCPIWLVPNPC